MLAFMKVLQPKTVEEAYELATKNKTAPMLAGGCWLRLGRRTWPAVIDMASLDLRYVREEDNEFVIGAMATQGDVERFEPLQQFCGGAVVKGVKEILGIQFRNTATMGGSVASRFGFSDIIPALMPVLTGALRRDDKGVEVYIGTRPGVPQLAEKASALLSEKGLSAAKEAGQLASEELVYQSNSHASKEYRMEMVKAMVQRLSKEVAQ